MNTEQIYNKLSNQLKYFIGKRISDPMVVDDILHDVFIKIHTNFNSLKNTNKLESWVFQITRNTIIDYYRQQKHFVEIEEDHLPYEKEAENSEIHTKASLGLTLLIDELPQIYREAILLTEFQGLSQRDLAEKMNISLPGAKSRVQRAKKMLRDLLLQCCHFEYDKYGTVIDYCKVCCCCSNKN